MRTNRAFTLIELLVVVSIIALLISILLPSLRSAREQAKLVVCLNNCKQMGAAMTAYGTEYQDRFPSSGGHGNPSENPKGWWLNILAGYTRQSLLYRCPSDRSKQFLDWNAIDWNTWDEHADEYNQRRWTSYALNYLFVKPPDPYCDHLLRIRCPQSVIIVSESPDDTIGADHTHPEKFLDTWPALPKRLLAADRHKGRSNYLFADSHADTLHYARTLKPREMCLWDPGTAPAWSQAMEDAPPPPGS
ncbi:MAG: DUF1559 domain-containing protein [Phycisphaerae bacterium]|nr:DUF1559 domain-containing protein [Phycisphaerae bacterium]